jgi:hypothetical protein
MLLDTNAVSEIVKNKNSELNFVDALENSTLPCVTTTTLFELRKQNDIYEKFLEVFSILPFFLIKPQNQVFEQELLHYPNPKVENVIAIAFSFLNEDPNAQPRAFLNKLFSDSAVLEVERNWQRKWKKESLDRILGLKKNFQPRFSGPNANDANRFVREAILQYIVLTAPQWASENQENLLSLQMEAFPSIQMMLYNVYYCFYGETRKWKDNDVFDILINSTAPYMDTVVTESFQADVLRKTRSSTKFASHLNILTTSFLREPRKQN